MLIIININNNIDVENNKLNNNIDVDNNQA